MRRIAQAFFWLLAASFFVAAAAYLYLRQSLPKTAGEITVPGLRAKAEVLRDAYGIPHIFAASVEDAHFALGFVHAQDRLWQMEMNRRIGAGRLAEVLGARALDTDRFLRTLGVRRVAEANLEHYDAATRAALDAYAAGVNAFLATRPVLPLEFWLLGVSPEPWTPADSVTWTKMMAWDLGGNWRAELLRMLLAATLPLERIQEFLPPYPGDAPQELPDLKELYRSLEAPPPETAGAELALGSNSWVLAGSRTASGKPLLANDPHLGLTAPAVWYFAHLNAPGLDVIGATLPGVPGVVVGRNERIAWGFTNTGPDVQDLYIEKLDGSFAAREELIKVKGAADERLTVRRSRHGPIISDVFQPALQATPRGYALALAWTALAEDDLTMQSAIKIGEARDWNGFLAAARDLHAPQQTVTYADVDGNIGFVAAGRVPIRKPGNDLKGLAPAPGWDARYDWAGYIPFDELPRAFNPREGAIVSANHKIVPVGYRHHITFEWQPPYRARRIEELLQETRAHDRGSFARMQGDVRSLAMRELLAKLPAGSPVLEKLGGWDGSMSAERAEALIAVAWWRELARAIYADELGEAFRANWSPRAQFVANVLGGQTHWCDDVRTPRVERCEEKISDALERALADLAKRYGGDARRWRWGDAHAALHRHRPLHFLDFSVASPGDTYTVNAGHSDFSDDAAPFASRHAASLRAIYDLGDLQASLFIHSGGQSGNPLSPHYRAFSAAWARGDYIPMLTDRERLEAAGVERLVLVPAR